MKQNNEPKKTNKINYNNKNNIIIPLKLKILLGILCFIILSTVVLFIIEVFIGSNVMSYYLTHFAMAVILVCIGFIIMILLSINKSRVVGENKGDSLMEKVAIAAFILGLLSIAFSYLGF